MSSADFLRGTYADNIYDDLYVSSGSCMLHGVLCRGHSRNGIYLSSVPAFVQSATSRNNGSYGIRSSSSLTVSNSAFLHNSLSGLRATSASILIEDCRFSSNGRDGADVYGATLRRPWAYSNDWHGIRLNGQGEDLAAWRTASSADAHSISADPDFFDPDGPDDIFGQGSTDNDFHLSSRGGFYHGDSWTAEEIHSPCIDADVPTLGTGSETEPHGDGMNLDAYGLTADASRSWTPDSQGGGTLFKLW